MRLILMGNRKLAEDILAYLIKSGHDTIAVFCHPDVSQNPLEQIAEKNNLRVYKPDNIKDKEEIRLIKSLKPDIIFSVFYKFIIPVDVIKIPKEGCINLHGGLLPEYRGCFPGVWSIINGEKYAGLTMHFIDKGIDTGDIIGKKRVLVDIADTGRTLYDKLTKAGLELFKREFQLLVKRRFRRVKQDESKAFYYPRIKHEEKKVNWDADNLKVYNFIRGNIFPPYPGPFIFFDDIKIEIFEVGLGRKAEGNAAPGTITGIIENRYLEVSTKDSFLLIKKIKIGDRVMEAAKYGRFKIGKRL